MRLRASYFILLAAALLAVASYGYGHWAEARRHEAALPRVGLGSLVEDLSEYYGRIGQFPRTLQELHRSQEQPATGLQFGTDGCSLVAANYLYNYRRVEPDQVIVWAIPVGERAREAATHFVVVGPGKYRHWKSPALSFEEATRVVADISKAATDASLKSLRLLEQTNGPTQISKGRVQIR